MALYLRLRPPLHRAHALAHRHVGQHRALRRQPQSLHRAGGAGPAKQIVLILDRAGWHTSPKLRVPDHVHLLFLPPVSPALQPAEHLWPLSDTALANRHFATIDDLEDAQAERCVALQARPGPLRHTVLLVATPDQETTRTLEAIVSGILIGQRRPARGRPGRPGRISVRGVFQDGAM